MRANSVNFKIENKPRTVLEKYNRLKDKNKNIELLKSKFNLDIEL